MERFLIGMLGRKYIYGRYYDGKMGGEASVKETIPVLFSNNTVQRINVTVQCNLQSSLAYDPSISIFGDTLPFPSFNSNPSTYDLTPRSSDIVVNMTWSGYWIINSFTTTDGKVHTANNLNY